jgi:hypothetical protein
VKRIIIIGLSITLGTNVLAQSLSFEDTAAFYFLEVRAVTQSNKNLWNYDLYAPIMLVDRGTRAVYANVPDSTGKLVKEKDIYIGNLPKEVNLANTSARWAGRHWAMILLPLPKEKSNRINLITHELFHRAQPYLKLRPRNYDNNHLDKKEGRIYLRLELEALRKAVYSQTKSEIHKHLASAIAFRKFRYAIYSEADSIENLLELNEGICEFTGAMMSGRTTQQMQEHFSKRIDAFLINQTFIRSFPYETTPIYGYLLSQQDKNWNKQITLKTNLTDLFIKSFKLKVNRDMKNEVMRIRDNYNGKQITEEETKREVWINELLSEYRNKFITAPHLELKFENMSVSFDYTNISSLDDKGVVYPTIRAKDNWGILTVTNGALMSPDWKKIIVSQPTEIQEKIAKGDGWTLELLEGYTIQQDVFIKIYYLVKK